MSGLPNEYSSGAANRFYAGFMACLLIFWTVDASALTGW